MNRLHTNIFITGTDTGVGKTIITGCLASYLKTKGYNPITQKWVQTGKENDINFHMKMLNDPLLRNYADKMNSYHFTYPSSPHLSSKLQSKKINIDRIKADHNYLKKKFDVIVVEGTGGLLAPLEHNVFISDIAKELKLVFILVILNKIGAINHALLSLNYLKKNGIKILGLIFNNLDSATPEIIKKDNIAAISKISNEYVFGEFQRQDISKIDLLNKNFLPIGEKILKRWKQL